MATPFIEIKMSFSFNKPSTIFISEIVYSTKYLLIR